MDGSDEGGGGIVGFNLWRLLESSVLVQQSFAIRVRCLSGHLREISKMSQGPEEATAIIFICAVFY